MIGIVDYGMGNLLSVQNAVTMLGGDVVICTRSEEVLDCERVILPGVGAFPDCMRNLQERGFVDALNSVKQQGRPVFGICLGMQAMARSSEEGGRHAGLGWFEADVVRLAPSDPALRIPHVGWNSVSFSRESPLFKGLEQDVDFYFVHSYFMKCDQPAQVDGACDYGGAVTAAVRQDNVFATQFHPEKSQDHGLRLLENFLRWSP